ncbi:MAG: hypothetical protein B7Y80_09545 [Hyphomicrobium sp. 32-62-53]|nr:MAG: hypothetical protein B7Z29_09170 [Hyphomicrobium sp. 12-62-95]OYX99821.1 MAG: hypothetical protein B7Y80_09545 [Hyphomicrobium sp. 32-62-53]
MAQITFGRGSKVRRALAAFLAATVVVSLVAGGVSLVVLGQAPPPPLLLPDGGQQHATESGVTWVPRIGTRVYGNCTRVLAIDGGGVKGLVPASILAELERRTGRPISQQFDLIAGTSTGAILALGLARPSNENARLPAFSAADLVGLYREYSERIFPRSFAPMRALRRVFRPKFSPEDVEAVFASYFEDVRLIEALTNVAIPAYDIVENRRIWFLSYASAQNDLLMRDIVRGATAAPTFFAPSRFAVSKRVAEKGTVALVDGALFANNPSQDAYLFGRRLRSGDDSSVLVLSIGTGKSTRKHSFEDAWGWGVLGWMDPLLEIAFSDPAIDDIMRRTLEGQGDYFRLQADFGGVDVALDDSSPQANKRLEDAAASYVATREDEMTRLAFELSLPRSPQCGPPLGADYERPEGPRLGQRMIRQNAPQH